MLLPFPKFLVDPEGLDFLPGKIEITVPSVVEKITHLLLLRAVELASAHCSRALRYLLPQH